MTLFERFWLAAVATGIGLLALGNAPDATATPVLTGGGACVETAAGGGIAMAGCAPVSAPLADMAGVPMALPGPIPVVPAGAPLLPAGPALPVAPVVPVVPVGAPGAGAPAAGAPVAGGAPFFDMAGGFTGKGDRIVAPPPGAPVSGRPILPGPASAGAR